MLFAKSIYIHLNNVTKRNVKGGKFVSKSLTFTLGRKGELAVRWVPRSGVLLYLAEYLECMSEAARL